MRRTTTNTLAALLLLAFCFTLLLPGTAPAQAKQQGLAKKRPVIGTLPPQLTLPRAFISEFRLRGDFISLDEYIEIYNPGSAPLPARAVDGSNGWMLAARGVDGRLVAIATIPFNVTIPAYGHYLISNSFFLLAQRTNADQFFPGDIPDDGGVVLCATTVLANCTTETRIDAAGFAGGTGPAADLTREGAGLASIGSSYGQHAFVRREASGFPEDTDDNARDFQLVATDEAIYGTTRALLGTPNPEALASPRIASGLKAQLPDMAAAATAAPNRQVLTRAACGALCNDNDSALGALIIRRKFVNTSDRPFDVVQFHVIDITAGSNAPGTTADLRVQSAAAEQITYASGETATTAPLIMLYPPPQPRGGGLGTVLRTPARLEPGASMVVSFRLGIMRNGNYRFYVQAETN